MTRSNPTETLATLIRLCVSSTVPHLRKTERRTFKTLKGAQAYAVRHVGERPAIVHQFTSSSVEAQGPQPNPHSCLTILDGCTFEELFPALAEQPSAEAVAARKQQPAVSGVYIIERVLKREAKFWSAWWAEQVHNGCHYCSDAFGRSAYLVSLDGKIDAALGLYCMPACARNAYKNRPAISPMTLASQPARKQQLQHTQLGKQQLQFTPTRTEPVQAATTTTPAPVVEQASKPAHPTKRCSTCEQPQPWFHLNGYGECTACADAKVARQRAASGLASDYGPAADAAIDQAIAALPATFGLRNHAGTTYRVSRAASFVSGGVIWLYTEALRDGQWLSAMRATPAEIARAVVADPNAQPAKVEQDRDRTSGQYVHSTLDLVCVCGHTLGVHSAASVDGKRPCFVEDGAGCSCERFRKARKQPANPNPTQPRCEFHGCSEPASTRIATSDGKEPQLCSGHAAKQRARQASVKALQALPTDERDTLIDALETFVQNADHTATEERITTAQVLLDRLVAVRCNKGQV